MSISRTLRNKPRVNYAVLHSGSEEFSPTRGNLELDHTLPHEDSKAEFEALGSFHPSPDENLKSELGALETEQEALTLQMEQLQKQALQDKRREVENLRKTVSQLQSAHCNPSGTEKVKTKDSRAKSAKPTINLDDLRQMESLSVDVEKKLKHFGLGEIPNDSLSSSEDVESSDEDTAKASKSRGKQHKKLKSGKTAKITSRIVNPQIWPHSELSLSHVSKEVAYDELSIEEFTAGYCAILKSKRLTEVERTARINHLYDIMYLAMHYEWSAVRRFHAAVLLEIERGHLQWGDSFHYLERHSFHDQLKRNVKQKSPQSTRANPVLFCRDYQRGKCRHDKDHFGTIRGNKKWLQHICAKCWITSRAMEKHPEFSSSCPCGDSAQESKPIASSN